MLRPGKLIRDKAFSYPVVGIYSKHIFQENIQPQIPVFLQIPSDWCSTSCNSTLSIIDLLLQQKSVHPDATSQGQPICVSGNKVYGAYKRGPVALPSTQGTCIQVEVSIVTANSKAKCIYLYAQSNSATPVLNCSFLLTAF